MAELASFDIRQVWETVHPGLSYIKEKWNPDWRPEDLYAACLAKRAFIFKPTAESEDFVLLSQNVSVYTGDAYLMVIAAYSKEGDAVATYQDEIDRIARESGAKSIEFSSPRIGWERHAKVHGYEPRMTIYRRTL